MTIVCHLFDGAAGWEQRLAVGQLLDGLEGARYAHWLAAIDPRAARGLRRLGKPVEALARLGGLTATASPAVGRFTRRRRADLLHAWGPQAALAARAASPVPLILELFDPCQTPRDIKIVRTLARGGRFAVVCSTQTLRRQLIEGGVPSELCLVIRPGVDFGLINKNRRGPLRARLGLSPDEFVITTPEDDRCDGGQLDALWAVVLADHILHNARFLLPGGSRRRDEIVRMAAAGPCPQVLIAPGTDLAFEEAIAICDALVITTRGDIATTSIAWAMASGAVTISAAVHAVAELLANNLNGLLFKLDPRENQAVAIARLLQDRAAHKKLAEVARGHAFEVFGIRRNVDQHMRLYENLLGGASPGEGIVDSAVVT